jgi:hypothetical protein
VKAEIVILSLQPSLQFFGMGWQQPFAILVCIIGGILAATPTRLTSSQIADLPKVYLDHYTDDSVNASDFKYFRFEGQKV